MPLVAVVNEVQLTQLEIDVRTDRTLQAAESYAVHADNVAVHKQERVK